MKASDFKGTQHVVVVYVDGTRLDWCAAFAAHHDEWLCVFTEHHGYHVIGWDEVESCDEYETRRVVCRRLP